MAAAPRPFLHEPAASLPPKRRCGHSVAASQPCAAAAPTSVLSPPQTQHGSGSRQHEPSSNSSPRSTAATGINLASAHTQVPLVCLLALLLSLHLRPCSTPPSQICTAAHGALPCVRPPPATTPVRNRIAPLPRTMLPPLPLPYHQLHHPP
ncbi:hypothetical protein SETIT_3G063600v2 [Setaria italica]|uniref:Uncharacterized protein n=1 Tax=Setaria italica TaxID=4555 RepID=A0A368QCH8_SETIT|nr:hypothetical protein SETIT_3G063600v2 [Setaria italica]